MKVETGMDTYLVTLVDRKTNKDQRVLVQDKNPDRDWQEWIDSKASTFDPPLTISNPRVMNVHKLKVKRPVGRTLMPQATAV